MAVFAAGVSGCDSSVLEAFVAKVSEVESEFKRRISELQDEFHQRISDQQIEYCVVNTTPESGSCPDITEPSAVTKEEWSVVVERRRVLKAQ